MKSAPRHNRSVDSDTLRQGAGHLHVRPHQNAQRPMRFRCLSLSSALWACALAGCSQSPAGLKVLNATNTEARMTAVSVNGKNVLAQVVLVPAGTAQMYSPEGHVPGASLWGGETLSITIDAERTPIAARCVLPPRPEGVCLVKARYDGSDALACGYDCDNSASR